MNKTILITGANSGLGKESAKQFAQIPETEKIYLACRSAEKASAARAELENQTGRKIFEIILLDTSNLNSVRSAVSDLNDSIDALVMNAGGMGGRTPQTLTSEGVMQMFAVNVLGHVVLVEALLNAGKLNNVAMYASSEAARGIDKMNIPRPKLETYSPEEFKSIFDGSFFKKWDPMEAYAYTKYVATLWMNAMARKHNEVRFISVSPGSTSGTNAMESLPAGMRFMFKYIMMPIVMPLRGMIHKLETGARRYVDAVTDAKFETGRFYASQKEKIVGPMVDQSTFFSDLNNQRYQDNAQLAINQVLAA